MRRNGSCPPPFRWAPRAWCNHCSINSEHWISSLTTRPATSSKALEHPDWSPEALLAPSLHCQVQARPPCRLVGAGTLTRPQPQPTSPSLPSLPPLAPLQPLALATASSLRRALLEQAPPHFAHSQHGAAGAPAPPQCTLRAPARRCGPQAFPGGPGCDTWPLPCCSLVPSAAGRRLQPRRRGLQHGHGVCTQPPVVRTASRQLARWASCSSR